MVLSFHAPLNQEGFLLCALIFTKDTAQSLWKFTFRLKYPIFCTMVHLDLVTKCVKGTNLVGPLIDPPGGSEMAQGPIRAKISLPGPLRTPQGGQEVVQQGWCL